MIQYFSHNKFKVVVSVRGIGKRQITVTGSKMEAEKAAEELKTNLLQERDTQKRIETFGDLFTLYHVNGKTTKKSRNPYHSPFKGVLNELSEFKIEDYSKILLHLTALRIESPRIYNRVIAVINHAYRDAHKKGLIHFAHKERINIATVYDNSYEVWNDVRGIFLDNPIIGDFVRFAESTPYTTSVLADLSRENSRKNGNLIFYGTYEAVTIIPVTNWSRDLLTKEERSDLGGRFFDLSFEELNQEWQSVCRQNNVRIRLHDMHRFATRKLTEEGICLSVAQIVGHWKDTGHLKRYRMTSSNDSDETWRSIEKKLRFHYQNLHPSLDVFQVGTYMEAHFIAALINLSQISDFSGILDSSVTTTLGRVNLSKLVQNGFYD